MRTCAWFSYYIPLHVAMVEWRLQGEPRNGSDWPHKLTGALIAKCNDGSGDNSLIFNGISLYAMQLKSRVDVLATATDALQNRRKEFAKEPAMAFHILRDAAEGSAYGASEALHRLSASLIGLKLGERTSAGEIRKKLEATGGEHCKTLVATLVQTQEGKLDEFLQTFRHANTHEFGLKKRLSGEDVLDALFGLEREWVGELIDMATAALLELQNLTEKVCKVGLDVVKTTECAVLTKRAY